MSLLVGQWCPWEKNIAEYFVNKQVVLTKTILFNNNNTTSIGPNQGIPCTMGNESLFMRTKSPYNVTGSYVYSTVICLTQVIRPSSS